LRNGTTSYPPFDVVIDSLRTGTTQSFSKSILDSVSQAAKSLRPAGSPKLSFIFTSATGVHGESADGKIITDTTPCIKPTQISGWRKAHEEKVQTHPILNGIVIRPSLLYGRSGSLFSIVFEEARKTGKVRWPGKPGARLPVIHQDDLAELYLKAADRAQVIGGMAFDAANDVSESVDGFLHRLAQVIGADGFEYREPEGCKCILRDLGQVTDNCLAVLDSILSQTFIVRPYLARSLLGWQPRKTGVADGLAVYYSAYLASVA